MRRHTFSGFALVAATALLLLPETSQAQFGLNLGGRRGGVSVGSGYGGYGYGNPGYGGYGYGNPGYGGYNQFGYGGNGYGGYNQFGYGGYNRGYPSLGNSYAPGYYGSNSYPGASSGYTYGNPAYNYGTPAYSPGSSGFVYPDSSSGSYNGMTAGTGGTNYSYGNMSPSMPAQNAARLNVRVPSANAEVWVEGTRTQQQGTWREFVSPALSPEKSYTYEVKARWMEGGSPVERTREVSVKANGVATVDFTTANRSDTDRNSNEKMRDTDRNRNENLRDGDRPRSHNDVSDPASPERRGTGTDLERRGTDTLPRGTEKNPAGTDTLPRGTEKNPAGTNNKPGDPGKSNLGGTGSNPGSDK